MRKHPFRLETLEPRIMLSADPVDDEFYVDDVMAVEVAQMVPGTPAGGGEQSASQQSAQSLSQAIAVGAHSPFRHNSLLTLTALIATALIIGCSSTEPSNEGESSSEPHNSSELLNSSETLNSSSSRVALSSSLPRSSSSSLRLSSSGTFVISSGTGEAAVNNQECIYSAINNTLACAEKTYKTVTINNVVWMAENLNYGQYVERMPKDRTLPIDGIDPQLLSGAEKFCDQNDENECEERGGLYQWHTVMGFETGCTDGTLDCGDRISDGNHQGICPKGWHIPSKEEWTAVAFFSGGTQQYSTTIEKVDALVTEEIGGDNSSGLNIYATNQTFVRGWFTTNDHNRATYHGKRGVGKSDAQDFSFQNDLYVYESVILIFGEYSGDRALARKSNAHAVRCVKD